MNHQSNNKQKFHTSVFVHQLENSVSFYETLFGHAPVKQLSDYAKFDLEELNLVFTMVKAPEQMTLHPQSPSHFGIATDSEGLAKAKARITDAGFSIDEEKDTVCCYALQDKFWVKDPSGYRWEIYQFKGDAPAESVSAKTEKTALKACC